MNDPTPNEYAALMQAGDAAGGYLDEIKKTDLATLTPEEWKLFLFCVVDCYAQNLQEMAARDASRLNALDPLP